MLKRTINKILALAMVITVMSSISANAFVKEDKISEAYDRKTEVGVSYEKLEELFPELNLKKNWRVGNRKLSLKNTKITDSEKAIEEVHNASYDGGECWVEVFQDGTYDVYGYEATDDATDNLNTSLASAMGTGYTQNGSTYTSYYRSATCGFQYKYSVSTSSKTGYSTISSLKAPTTYGNQYSYFIGAGYGYNRATQTSATVPAKVYGKADMYSYSGSVNFVSTFTLTTSVNSGKVAVSVSAGL